MELLSSWQFILAASLSSFIIGMSRGGFAGGIAFAGVLIMTQVVEPTIAAAFILPVLCFIDPFGNYIYRKSIHWPNAKILIPGGLVGIAIGTAIFYLVNNDVIRILIALLSIFMIIDRLYHYYQKTDHPRVYPKLVGFIFGVVAGISTFIIHAGHPPVSAYLLPQKLPRMLFLGTFAILFTIFNYVKLAPYAWLDLLDFSLLKLSAIFFPITILGFFTGKYIAQKMSDRMFYIIMYLSVFIMGIKIGIEGLVNLI